METFKNYYLITESGIEADDLSTPFTLSEVGFNYLSAMLEQINKKAVKWGVPPLELKVIKEEERNVGVNRDYWGHETPEIRKYFTVSVIGQPPKVEGYTFVAKIEHTAAGNLLNLAPNSPVKNLPELYKTIEGDCDVCHRSKDRSNTFILQLDKEDPERFPDKHAGDLIQAGSICLKRFLDSNAVNKFIQYAKDIEAIRAAAQSGEEYDDSFEGGRYGSNSKYVPTHRLLFYLCCAYTATGKFISNSAAKRHAEETGEPMESTAQDGLFLMDYRPTPGRREPRIVSLINQPALLEQAEKLYAKVLPWMKEQDFTKANTDPQWDNFFHNLSVISRSEIIEKSRAGYLAAILNQYIRTERETERVKLAETAAATKKYVGNVGEKIEFVGKLISQKAFPSPYGVGTSHYYTFEDKDGNYITWWSSKDMGFKDGESYKLAGTVKRQEINKYTKQPNTVITRAKLK